MADHVGQRGALGGAGAGPAGDLGRRPGIGPLEVVQVARRSSVISPWRPRHQNRPVASSGVSPSRTMTSRSMSAMPTPAVPAPWITTRWSAMRVPLALAAANAAASTTAAVPCMSSLKVQHWSA